MVINFGKSSYGFIKPVVESGLRYTRFLVWSFLYNKGPMTVVSKYYHYSSGMSNRNGYKNN